MTRRHFFRISAFLFVVYISLNSSFHNFGWEIPGRPKKDHDTISNTCNMHDKHTCCKYKKCTFNFEVEAKKYRNKIQRFNSAIPEVTEAKEENNHSVRSLSLSRSLLHRASIGLTAALINFVVGFDFVLFFFAKCLCYIATDIKCATK